jgi:ribosome-binding factor A
VLSRGMADPRIRGLVSVTRVEVTDDLHEAFVYLTVLPDTYEKRTLAGIRAAGGRIRTEIGKRVALRTLPKLEFRLDVDLRRQDEVFDAIARGLAREGLTPSDIPHHLTSTPVADDDASEMGDSAEKTEEVKSGNQEIKKSGNHEIKTSMPMPCSEFPDLLIS